MSEDVTIVCLANSRKHSGRCIAGKIVSGPRRGEWVRPVGARVTEEVSEDERRYENGQEPQLLDRIFVPVLREAPKPRQPENLVLDAEFYWILQGRVDLDRIEVLVDSPESLWSNDSSSANGSCDRVPLAIAEQVTASLYLIQVSDLRFEVFAPGAYWGNNKRRVQANFTYRGVRYGLWVTDPLVESKYLQLDDGSYNVEQAYLTISLGEPFTDGFCYKLVAGVSVAQESD